MTRNQQLAIMINHFESNKTVKLCTYKQTYLCNKKFMSLDQFIELFNNGLLCGTVTGQLISGV